MVTLAQPDSDLIDITAAVARLGSSADKVRRALKRRPDLRAKCPVLWTRVLIPISVLDELRQEIGRKRAKKTS